MSYTETEITRQTAGMVATALGDGWTVDTSENFAEHRDAYMDGPDGARLALGPIWNKPDRLEIRGVYPAGARSVYPAPARSVITVDRHRAPDAIAREITRRLLPGYLPELARIDERVSHDVTAYRARCKATQRLQAAMPGLSEDRDDTPERGRATLRLPHKDHAWGDIELWHGGDTVNMSLNSLPLDLAIKIARLVANA